ncbi:diguanylate cyclase [Sphingomonas vulcanisoli]|uniref:diguanylate cyclase n=1 Tax=Sphingomonas vulcanisoli TaxID=1658060 RepID=A0ABX0TNW5_9SPHN|nr:GGDEF domain-containing protein [Sphingomonas vulcanisoli]NIJ06798.1 diguanylate cyclase [Sphingomonas vulcanisoli]
MATVHTPPEDVEPQRRSGLIGALSRFGRTSAEAEPAAAPAPPRPATVSSARRLYDRIGDFLFRHSLELTPLNFGAAHDVVGDINQELINAVSKSLLEGEPISNAWIERFYGERPEDGLGSGKLEDIANSVEAELGRCIALIGQSGTAQKEFGDALTSEIATLETTPAQTLSRVVELTRKMVAQTRSVDQELRERREQAQTLRSTLRTANRVANLDHLTNLPNRRAFEKHIRDLTAAVPRSQKPVLAMCDIDHFKKINDAHGHATGDRVLKLIAKQFQEIAGDFCFAARFGGEEFVLLFQDTSMEEAAAEIDRIRTGLLERKLVDKDSGRPLGQVNFSAGIAELDDLADVHATIERADTALYAAKNAGRGRTCVAA